MYIRDYAFADCYNLKYVVIPSSVIYIGYGILSQCHQHPEIHGTAGSFAELYAEEKNITFVALQDA